MNTNIKSYLALAFSAALITTSFAGPGNANLTDYPTRITSKEQAEKLEKGTKLAFTCTSCKTVNPIEEKKTFLSWFAPDQTHGCSGCGGKVTVVSVPGGKAGPVTIYKHICTKCGDKSAYTCAGHKS
jgi:Na+-translocating ferredoxin:NAD+ oxidoreductase RNF subunit RnfB